VVLVEGDDPVPVTAWLMSVDTDSPILRWHGRVEPRIPGALWAAHLAREAELVIAGVTTGIRITVYADSGPCIVEGMGPPPFL
jgi:hypothetical protein